MIDLLLLFSAHKCCVSMRIAMPHAIQKPFTNKPFTNKPCYRPQVPPYVHTSPTLCFHSPPLPLPSTPLPLHHLRSGYHAPPLPDTISTSHLLRPHHVPRDLPPRTSSPSKEVKPPNRASCTVPQRASSRAPSRSFVVSAQV